VLTSGRKVRTYSGGEILKSALRIAFAGRAGVRDRSRLDLWYAPRRPDPNERRLGLSKPASAAARFASRKSQATLASARTRPAGSARR
jgi:hypothetical protein